VMKRVAPIVGVTAVVAAVVCASAYPAAGTASDRHGYGNHPVIVSTTNPTMTSGDGTQVRVRVDYVDAGCKVVGGTWIDPNGSQHDFSVGPNDSCHAGIGSLAPGDASCTSPTGEPSQPGSYQEFMIVRDDKGNESEPFAFSVTCAAP
jgi:hypothetical protein